MELKNGWMRVEPIKKSELSEEFKLGMAKVVKHPNFEAPEIVYFEKEPIKCGEHFFVNEANVIAYE